MSIRSEIEDLRPENGAKVLAKMAHLLGYTESRGQYFSDGTNVGDLLDFLDDNPGAVVAVIDWVLDEGRDREGSPIGDGDDEEDAE